MQVNIKLAAIVMPVPIWFRDMYLFSFESFLFVD